MVCVVPITKTRGEGPLYPVLDSKTTGLRLRSYALVDQIRCIDKRRITRLFGRISTKELNAIERGLKLFLGLS